MAFRDGSALTKTHPQYDCHSPIRHWTDQRSTQPRVLTYTRKGHGLLVEALQVEATRDMHWVLVNGFTFVNAYRGGDELDVLQTLGRWDPPENTMLAGDFNAHHPSWQPGKRPNTAGNQLYEWTTDHQLMLTSEPGIATHELGNTLDLVFSNIPFLDTRVARHLHTTSDHDTLITVVPIRQAQTRQSQAASRTVGQICLTCERWSLATPELSGQRSGIR